MFLSDTYAGTSSQHIRINRYLPGMGLHDLPNTCDNNKTQLVVTMSRNFSKLKCSRFYQFASTD